MKKWILGVLSLLTVATLFAERFFLPEPGHFHWWNRIPAFFLFFGFFGCVLLIFVAKALGKYWLTRKENYYNEND